MHVGRQFSACMGLIWAVLAVLVLVVGVRYRQRVSSRWSGPTPVVDDKAIQRIIEQGQLTSAEDTGLDLDAAAEAEEDFWSEYWDEPDEYQP